jgi:hypothetical protein
MKRNLIVLTSLIIFGLIIVSIFLRVYKEVEVITDINKTKVKLHNFDHKDVSLSYHLTIRNNGNNSGPYSIILKIDNDILVSILGEEEIVIVTGAQYPYRREYYYSGVLFAGEDLLKLDRTDLHESIEVQILYDNQVMDSYKIKEN